MLRGSQTKQLRNNLLNKKIKKKTFLKRVEFIKERNLQYILLTGSNLRFPYLI